MRFLILILLSQPALAKKKRELVIPPPPQPPVVVTERANSAPAVPGLAFDEFKSRQLTGTDFNARRLGDLVTVFISEETATSLVAETDTSKRSETSLGLKALFGAEQAIQAAGKAGGELSLSAGSSSDFSGRGATQRGSQIYTTLTCEVIDVQENGNLRIWGWKRILINREVQYVSLDGIVRPRDIQMDNTVSADLLARASVEVTGNGVLADKQGPGILTRALDLLWPF